MHFPDADRAELVLPIVGESGGQLYTLECHSPAFGTDQVRPDFDYSGDFECRLTSATGRDRHSTLLTEEVQQSRDWQSRARFLVPELRGDCARYPEYGLVRQFRLRGMHLTLEMSDVTFRKRSGGDAAWRSELGSFTFTVVVRPDSTATRNIAETPAVSPPPPTCGAGYRAADEPTCPTLSTADDVRRLVGSLGRPGADNIGIVRCLSRWPAVAAPVLVSVLRPVRRTVIAVDDQSRFADDMRVIWALRALQHMTNGLRFTAPTSHRFGGDAVEQGRAHMLRLHSGPAGEVTFYGTWMSRDTTYLAPIDAQTAVIGKWRHWVRTLSPSFEYRVAETLEQWYF